MTTKILTQKYVSEMNEKELNGQKIWITMSQQIKFSPIKETMR